MMILRQGKVQGRCRWVVAGKICLAGYCVLIVQSSHARAAFGALLGFIGERVGDRESSGEFAHDTQHFGELGGGLSAWASSERLT